MATIISAKAEITKATEEGKKISATVTQSISAFKAALSPGTPSMGVMANLAQMLSIWEGKLRVIVNRLSTFHPAAFTSMADFCDGVKKTKNQLYTELTHMIKNGEQSVAANFTAITTNALSMGSLTPTAIPMLIKLIANFIMEVKALIDCVKIIINIIALVASIPAILLAMVLELQALLLKMATKQVMAFLAAVLENVSETLVEMKQSAIDYVKDSYYNNRTDVLQEEIKSNSERLAKLKAAIPTQAALSQMSVIAKKTDIAKAELAGLPKVTSAAKSATASFASWAQTQPKLKTILAKKESDRTKEERDLLTNAKDTFDKSTEIVKTQAKAVQEAAVIKTDVANGNKDAEVKLKEKEAQVAAQEANLSSLAKANPAIPALKEQLKQKKLAMLKQYSGGSLSPAISEDLFDYVIRTQALNPYSRERQCDRDFLQLLVDISSDLDSKRTFIRDNIALLAGWVSGLA